MQVPQNLATGPAGTTDKTSGSSSADQQSDGGAFNDLYKTVSQQDGNKGARDGRAPSEDGSDNPSQESGTGAALIARMIGADKQSQPAETDGKSAMNWLEGVLGDPPTVDAESDASTAGQTVQNNSALAGLMASASPIGQMTPRNGGTMGSTSSSSGGGASSLQNVLQGQGQTEASLTSGTATAAIDQLEGGNDTLFARFAVKPEAVSLDARRGVDGLAGRRGPVETVEVVRQETHFAPSQRIPPIQQVGQALTQALAGEQSAQGASAPLSFGDVGQGFGQTSGSAVKILEIRLQPQELGTVRVTMRIVEDRLQVDVRSANEQTVELLQKDKHMLDRLLHASGYKADSVTVQGIGDERSPFQITAGANAQNANNGNWQGEGRGTSQFGGDAAGNGDGQQGSQQNGGEDTRQTVDQHEADHGPDARTRDNRTDGQALYI